MPAYTLVLSHVHLTLRSTARADRARLLDCLEVEGSATVDVSVVEYMSDAYADELFGVITQYFGSNWVLDRIGVIGADEAILRTIAHAISQRARASQEPATPTLHPENSGADALRH